MDQPQNGVKLGPGQELYHNLYGFCYQILVPTDDPYRWWCAVPPDFKAGMDAPPSICKKIALCCQMQHRIILFDFRGVLDL